MIGFTVVRFAPGTPMLYFEKIAETSIFQCSSGLDEFSSNFTYCTSSFFDVGTVNGFMQNCTDCLSVPCNYQDGTDAVCLDGSNQHCLFGTIRYFQVSEVHTCTLEFAMIGGLIRTYYINILAMYMYMLCM